MTKVTNNKTSPNTTVTYMNKIGRVVTYDRPNFMLYVLVQKNKYTWIQEKWPVFACDTIECKIKNYVPSLSEIFVTIYSTNYNDITVAKPYEYMLKLK